MKKVICFMGIMACLLVVAWNCGCLEDEDEDKDQGTEENIVVMTFGELMNDFNQSENNDTKTIKEWFETLDEGDILIIHDKILNITHNETLDYTGIEFESSTGNIFSIAGDVTDRFREGDTVNVTLHTILTNFTQQDPYSGETWTIEMEIFQEIWDEGNESYTLTPQENIQLVTREGATTIMTWGEFFADSTRDIDNETKRVTITFQSLDDGDTVLIRDTIQNITYWESNNYTSLEFVSASGNKLHIQDNITGEFEVGDDIELELTIKTFVFTENEPTTGETWTFEYETFTEGWDEENRTYIPVPQECIRLT